MVDISVPRPSATERWKDGTALGPETACVVPVIFPTEGLKAHSYARSELTDLRVRYTSDGQELERLVETYTLQRAEDGWKIVVAMIHDPDTLFRCA
jgi:hypothetical protein